MQKASTFAAGSIGVGVLVLGLKAAAWQITGSAALYSDALESLVNVAAAIVALVALRFADRPADANHPYGHDKAEFFSAVIEGALIIVAAVSILQHAWWVFLNPAPFEAPLVGMALNAAATVVNAGWAWVLLRRGRALRSPALRADGAHLVSDVVTSTGVLIGVTLVLATGYAWLDPVVAACTAAYILVAGAMVVRSSVGGLMDAAPADEIVQRIRGIVADQAAGAIEAHDLRMRHAGRHTFLDFHLVVPGSLTVQDAHDICDRVEAALKAALPELLVTIHVEPETKAKHHGVLVL
jgi:cation diffusion facilitator family transporter